MKEENTIKAYKAFEKDMTCRYFQYEVGKEYEMDGKIECCTRGFHACESPFELFFYYDMCGSRFAEVELSGTIDRKKATLLCASRIEVKKELTLRDILNAGFEWIKHNASPIVIAKGGTYSDNGYDANKIVAFNQGAKLASHGRYAQLVSLNEFSHIGSMGSYSVIASSGDDGYIASSGYGARIVSSGENAQIASSGDFAEIVSFGDAARISTSGYKATVCCEGEGSVVVCSGCNSKVKACVGTWITLTEWKWCEEMERKVPFTCTRYVDGELIKADTWYTLKYNDFVETEI